MFIDESNGDEKPYYHFVMFYASSRKEVVKHSYSRSSSEYTKAQVLVKFPNLCPCTLERTNNQIKRVLINYKAGVYGSYDGLHKTRRTARLVLYPYCNKPRRFNSEVAMYFKEQILHVLCQNRKYAEEFMNVNGDPNCYIVSHKAGKKTIWRNILCKKVFNAVCFIFLVGLFIIFAIQ